jgi:cytochrome c peroxidase
VLEFLKLRVHGDAPCSRATLEDVLPFYIRGGNPLRHRDKEIQPLWLSGQDRADLVEFLKSLTGEMPANSGPLGKQ